MSDEDIKRTKRHQAVLSQASGIAGIAGLAGVGTALAAKKPKFARHIPAGLAGKEGKALKARAARGDQAALKEFSGAVKDKGYILGSVGTGVGAAGSFNFARIARAEGGDKNKKRVKKSIGVDSKDTRWALTDAGVAGGGAALGGAGYMRYRKGNEAIKLVGAPALRGKGSGALMMTGSGALLGIAGLSDAKRMKRAKELKDPHTNFTGV